MKKYVVSVKEVWYQPILIEANSPEEAITLVEDGRGRIMHDQFEYSHTIESDEWPVHDVPKEV